MRSQSAYQVSGRAVMMMPKLARPLPSSFSLRKAAEMSGPSRFSVVPTLRSPLAAASAHDFPLPLRGPHSLFSSSPLPASSSLRLLLNSELPSSSPLVYTPPPSSAPLLPQISPNQAEEENDENNNTIQCIKRTYQPSKCRRRRTHGFLVRIRRQGGRNLFERRLTKGRKRLSVA
ncbi:Ribosomal protein L34 [Balamuthia mandrillaris]